jgi:hypothetical protein
MLNSLDVLIGFTVVMLVVSMAVTMITQFIGTTVMNLRGKTLHEGLSRLLALMDKGLDRQDAGKIADYILRNPLVTSATSFFGKYRLACVIHRDELARLLLDYAVPMDAAKADPQKHGDDSALRAALRDSLARNGIENPEEVLLQVRSASVELEKTNPELSHSQRSTIALLNFASSDFLSKLNSWFDQTVDRTSALFTRRIRVVTAVVGLAVAVLIQLDAIGVINRLSVDEKLRERLVTMAIRKQAEWEKEVNRTQVSVPTTQPTSSGAGAPPSPPPPSPPPTSPPPPPPPPTFADAQKQIEELGIFTLPASPSAWLETWKAPPPPKDKKQPPPTDDRVRRAFGILLAAALLSLGSSFWYAMLANLLKLRSVITRKEEEQRSERQTSQVPGAAPNPGAAKPGTLPPELAGGEAGNLAALG